MDGEMDGPLLDNPSLRILCRNVVSMEFHVE